MMRPSGKYPNFLVMIVVITWSDCGLYVRRRDHYITMVKWRDSNHLMVAWSNRVQNHTVLTLCNAKSTDCQLVWTPHLLVFRFKSF